MEGCKANRESVLLLLCLRNMVLEVCQFAQESLLPGCCAAGTVVFCYAHQVKSLFTVNQLRS